MKVQRKYYLVLASEYQSNVELALNFWRYHASKLWNEARDDFLTETFKYEVNSINSINISVCDPINNCTYENEMKTLT